jgi:hypothetical protein
VRGSFSAGKLERGRSKQTLGKRGSRRLQPSASGPRVHFWPANTFWARETHIYSVQELFMLIYIVFVALCSYICLYTNRRLL